MGKKILIVDDDVKNRKLLRVLLQNSGYETIEAEDGQQAINLARENNPDLILMDIRMPVMDGIEATKILKSEGSTAGIPVIALTSYALKGDRERILTDAGCDDYVTKPIEIKLLLEIVRKYTGE